MRACRVATLFAAAPLALAGVIEACGGDPPSAPRAPAPVSTVAAPDAAAGASAVDVAFFEGRASLVGPPCSRLVIVAAKGTVALPNEVLKQGDVMVIQHPDPIDAVADGLAVRAVSTFPCSIRDKPHPVAALRRAGDARELRWAKGQMRAHLDVGADVSPDLYVGRLEGTAAVAEHRHATSEEILVAVAGAGTFTIDGTPHRLGPKQIVRVPKDTPHSWTPDPGASLVAVQLYAPPGPEQRFVALDAAERDAGAPAK